MSDEGTRDPMQSEHEREVAEFEESATGGKTNAEDDATDDPGRRPTSAEELAADRDERHEDVAPHGSLAEGGSTEPVERGPRPSKPEGDR